MEKEIIIENSTGMKCSFSRYGASLVSLTVPSKYENDYRDVVLGLKDTESYSTVEKNSCFLGCVVGRNCNRVKNATFELNETQYFLSKNVPPNHLHGDLCFRRFDILHHEKSSICFSLTSKDGDEGFPCEIKVLVTYKIAENVNELIIDYQIENVDSDRSTISNFTNHSYFNLHGVEKKNIRAINDHKLLLKASEYTELDKEFVPNGKLISVQGKKFDFRKPKTIGKGEDYDLNYSLDRKDQNSEKKELFTFSELFCEDSGIRMTAKTTSVGCQLYNSVFMKDLEGKYDVTYQKHYGVCLETQYFPNAMNIESFRSPIIPPKGKQRHSTSFLFTTE